MLEVLFVCTGNIIRSPFAEAVLVDRARGLPDGMLRVRSAGTWGREGNRAMPEMVDAARAMGIDLQDHRAAPLTADAIDAADLVIGLTSEHSDEITRMVPNAGARTFTLKELAVLLPGVDEPAPSADPDAVRERIAAAHALRGTMKRRLLGDLDVADPIGMGDEVHAAIAWEIAQAVDALARGLFGVAEVSVQERP